MSKQLKALTRTGAAVLVLIGIYSLSSLISSGITGLIISFLGISQKALTTLPMAMLVLVPGFLINLLLLHAWVRFIEKSQLKTLGLPKAGSWKSLLQGCLIALLINSVLVASLMAFGLVKFQGMSLAPVQLGDLFLILAATLLQGANEEVIFRAWFFPALSRHYGQWFGLTVSAFFFGLLHILSGYQDLGLVLNIVLFGTFLCLCVWEKGTIWGAIGIHAMNNFLMTGVFVLNTGNPAAQPFGILVFDSSSPALSAGFMGSWQASFLYGGLVLLMIFRRLRKSSEKIEYQKDGKS